MAEETYIKNNLGEKFTFAQGMINSIRGSVKADIDQTQMSTMGPMSNQGMDCDGVGKTITITGRFFDTDSSVLSDGSDQTSEDYSLQDKLLMKYWFEAIPTGFQTAIEFSGYVDEKSAESSFSKTDFVDSVSGKTISIHATFVNTKVYLLNFDYDIEEGDLEKINFTIVLWVAGF
jgi:hypothetical protein